ncbi:hypothetical protein GIB67_002798 [Kingdonia uniflora]|uniref:C-CAP/cofactor C-like domain-containing protein n=1 Tax=Kingdonia uniflora TaxID=39325 RepID=A0A7J7M580_9MAGN|nr:hypothetical protein GIB67_002798 [Kingdonia uniflora]
MTQYSSSSPITISSNINDNNYIDSQIGSGSGSFQNDGVLSNNDGGGGSGNTKHQVWPPHIEAAEFDRLHKLLSAALLARKAQMKKQTRLTICEGHDGTKTSNGEKPDLAGLGEFLQPLNEVIVKANALTEEWRSDFFNHLKSAADSLMALAWIAYYGKDCGTSLPIAHVEESWQMPEFYNNKILVECKSKDPDHVEWAKALKELYVPGLRDYVKSIYLLGSGWSLTGKTNVSAPAQASLKAPPPGAPAPPPTLTGSLFSSDCSKAPASRLKARMAAAKSKNRTDKTGIVAASGKEIRTDPSSFSKTGPPKLELQMGRKWVVENQIGRNNLVIDDCDSKQVLDAKIPYYKSKVILRHVQNLKLLELLRFWRKVNNITVDKCTKMAVAFMDVVAACEIVSCDGVEVQCQRELELPQQFISVFKDGQFLTSRLALRSLIEK